MVLERKFTSDWRGRTPACHDLKIERKPGSQVRRICTLCDVKDSHEQREGRFEVIGKKGNSGKQEARGGIQNRGRRARFG